jgi:hypothetical protein
MNEHDASNPALEELLRAHAPTELADDGFVGRTLAAVERAALSARTAPPPRPASAREIAQALAAEERRYAAYARVRRWGMFGVAAGVVLLVVAILGAPSGVDVDIGADAAALPAWFPMWTMLAVGALWYAWQEFRANWV